MCGLSVGIMFEILTLNSLQCGVKTLCELFNDIIELLSLFILIIAQLLQMHPNTVALHYIWLPENLCNSCPTIYVLSLCMGCMEAGILVLQVLSGVQKLSHLNTASASVVCNPAHH